MTITYQPQVWDVRPDDAGSLSVLPRLAKGDFQTLFNFMKSHWPEFDVIGTHGENRATSGQRWWAIGAIEVKEGAGFQVQFRKDENTYDTGNILSLFHWNDAPEDISELDVTYYPNAVYSFSNGADSVGYPYGSSSGPYAIWLNSDPANWTDRRVGSDAIVGLHWFDNHVSLNCVFWPMRKDGYVSVPTGRYRLVLRGPNDEILGSIPFTTDLLPIGVRRLELWRDDERIGNVPWQAS